jgi:hypothetical protein
MLFMLCRGKNATRSMRSTFMLFMLFMLFCGGVCCVRGGKDYGCGDRAHF